MKWEGRQESKNVEDRRGMSPQAGLAIGGGLGGIIILLLALVFGVDPKQLAGIFPQGQQGQPGQVGAEGEYVPADPREDEQAHFCKVIFRDTEDVWDELFRQMRPPKEYQKPTLVLFSGRVESACGLASSAVGPFYCPGDGKVYIDLAFLYKDMEAQLNAPGKFAQAYVIAHEVGHHVQRLLGYAQRVDEARRRLPEEEYNKESVRLELQADYLAGVWAHHGQKRYNFLEKGDVESAVNAAFQIGDDRLQKRSQGYVVPEKFNHGTSKQRMRWFQEGLRSGDVNGARTLFELDYRQL
jgi:predicted metalloprotease